jgi:hypothetical protein
MNNTNKLNNDLETIAWGLLFIWWGITEIFEFLPQGTGALGIALILLGLNMARFLKGIPTKRFSITVGILALVMGGMQWARSVMHLPFDIPIFAVLLIVFGVLILIPETSRNITDPQPKCEQ